MRLIVEHSQEVESQIILDESTKEKNTYIHGVFLQSELKNRNGRVYPKSVLEAAVNKYNELYINQNRALGETEHPNYPNPNLAKACIKIESLGWSGNDVIGKARVLNTTEGKNLAALIDAGVKVGVSSRGLGTVKQGKFNNETVNIVESDYEIRAIDVVSAPSGIDCFVDGILEGVEYYYDNGILSEREIIKIQENVRKNDIEAINKDFDSFVKKVLKIS